MDLSKYGVQIKKTELSDYAWRVDKVEKLSGEENAGGHHIYIRAYDEHGIRVEGVSVKSGGYSYMLDKPGTLMEKGHGDIPMFPGAVYEVEMIGGGDMVTGLHTSFPTDEPGNSWHHHSFRITFVWRKAKGELPDGKRTTEDRLHEVEIKLESLINHLRAIP